MTAEPKRKLAAIMFTDMVADGIPVSPHSGSIRAENPSV